jgi:hypothetical protein
LRARTILIALLFSAGTIIFFSGCEKLIDPHKVVGVWVIRKDSSEMKLDISKDSVKISYLPDHTHYAYNYRWKQDEEPGLMECDMLVPLDKEHLAVKIIPSRMYILRVSSDSISVYIPGLKTKFDMKRDK